VEEKKRHISAGHDSDLWFDIVVIILSVQDIHAPSLGSFYSTRTQRRLINKNNKNESNVSFQYEEESSPSGCDGDPQNVSSST
jgi:hypothetical protein